MFYCFQTFPSLPIVGIIFYFFTKCIHNLIKSQAYYKIIKNLNKTAFKQIKQL